MQNQNEFLDNTPALNPDVVASVNAEGGDGTPVSTTRSRDNINDQISNSFDSFDFTSTHSLARNAKYFERVQDLSNLVLNGLRVPFVDNNFRPYIIPKSRQNVPVLPSCFTVNTPYYPYGTGNSNFDEWLTVREMGNFDFSSLALSQEPLTVKMSNAASGKLMTLASIWTNEYIDKGVRDSRARPSAVAGDWAWALPPNYSLTHRNIRTDVFAYWMYIGQIFTTSTTVINANDLKEFMNVTGGSYWPIAQNVLCLALGNADAVTLSKLQVLGHLIIIDLDSSMNANKGTATTLNGVPAWDIASVGLITSRFDSDVARVLVDTYSAVDIQWALLANVLPLPTSSSGCVFANNNFQLTTYENSIADQFINFYLTHHDYGSHVMCSQSGNLLREQFVQSWRIFKTILTQRSVVELGYVGQVFSDLTYGKAITPQNYYDSIACEFELQTYNGISHVDYVLWIPYELWISNGANIQLDQEDYVDGESQNMVNTIYKTPRSQVLLTLSQWSDNTPATQNWICQYWIPNSTTATPAPSILLPGDRQSECQFCVPCTVPCYKSTTETATRSWRKDQTIDFVYTAAGKNSNSIYRKKLVFSNAAKN